MGAEPRDRLRARHRSVRLDPRPRGARPPPRRRLPLEPRGPVPACRRPRDGGTTRSTGACRPRSRRKAACGSRRARGTARSSVRCRPRSRRPSATCSPTTPRRGSPTGRAGSSSGASRRRAARLRPQAHRMASRGVPRPGLPRRPVRPRRPRRPRGGELVPPDAVVARVRGSRRVGLGAAAARGRGRVGSVGAQLPAAGRLGVEAADRRVRPRGGRAPADRWLEVRYEDFVADPRTVMAEILAFLELDWTSVSNAASRGTPSMRDGPRPTCATSGGRRGGAGPRVGAHLVALRVRSVTTRLSRQGRGRKSALSRGHRCDALSDDHPDPDPTDRGGAVKRHPPGQHRGVPRLIVLALCASVVPVALSAAPAAAATTFAGTLAGPSVAATYPSGSE